MKQIIITSQNGKTNRLNGCVGLGPGGNTVANNQSNKKGGCGVYLTSSEVLIPSRYQTWYTCELKET